MHTFYLIMEKDLNEAKSTTYFLTWLKETCEFLMPNNTLTTNKEFFDMMKKSQQISSNVNSRETNEYIIYYTKQKL